MATLAIAGGNARAAMEVWTFSDGNAYDTFIATGQLDGGYASYGSYRNYGGSSYFGANEPASARGLLRFDVSGLAGQYIAVQTVELRLYQQAGGVANVDVFPINDANSNWQEGTDTGSFDSGGGAWCRTTWSSKLRGLSDNSWDGGYGLGSTGYDTPALVTGTTTGAGWMSMFFGGDLTALMDDWVQSPVVGGYGRFAEPEQFTVVANEGMLILADGYVEWSSSQGSFSPELVVTVLVPDPSPGDFDEDYDVDADDIDILCDNMGSLDPKYDLDDGTGSGDPDGDVDDDDLVFLIENLAEWDNGVDTGVGTNQGDFNLDGLVNATDLAIMKATFGASGVGYADGNANCDIVVNATDLAILKGTFGFAAPTGGAVPEPVTIGLLSLGSLGLLRGRRRSR